MTRRLKEKVGANARAGRLMLIDERGCSSLEQSNSCSVVSSASALDGHDVELERALCGQLVPADGVLVVQQRALEQQSLMGDRNLVVLSDALLQLKQATSHD